MHSAGDGRSSGSSVSGCSLMVGGFHGSGTGLRFPEQACAAALNREPHQVFHRRLEVSALYGRRKGRRKQAFS